MHLLIGATCYFISERVQSSIQYDKPVSNLAKYSPDYQGERREILRDYQEGYQRLEPTIEKDIPNTPGKIMRSHERHTPR